MTMTLSRVAVLILLGRYLGSQDGATPRSRRVRAVGNVQERP